MLCSGGEALADKLCDDGFKVGLMDEHISSSFRTGQGLAAEAVVL